MSRGGFYWRLRDKNTSWVDRIKLCRYAWKFREVSFPNKEQVLLDWLVYALSERHCLDESEVKAVWQCFHDVLHTHQCHAATTHSQSTALSLKASITQILIEEILAAISTSKSKSTASCDLVIKCCYKIVASPNLSYVFTSHSDKLLQLCEAVCLLLNYSCQLQEPDVNIVHALQLLASVLQHNIQILSRGANPTQMAKNVSQKLLLPALLLVYNKDSYTHRALIDNYASCSRLIATLIRAALFHKDLKQYFDNYLTKRLDVDGAGVGRLHQVIDGVFHVFSQALSGSVEETCAVLDFLPRFYEGFLSMESSHDNCMTFEMQQFIVQHCLTVDLKQSLDISTLPDWAQVEGKSCHLLKAVCGLLSVTLDKEIYDIAADNEAGHQQLKWYRSFTTWLLHLETRCAEWYDCISVLLQLNPAIIEPNLTKVLEKTVVNHEEDVSESCNSKDNLFISLVQLYQKLSQIPKLVGKLLDVLKSPTEPQHHQVSYLPTTLASSLGEAFTKLAVTSQLSIWEVLIQSVEEQCSNCMISDLLCVFLIHAQIADYNLAAQVSQRVDELMLQTWTRCCQALVDMCVREKDTDLKLTLCLHVLSSWVELSLLLKQYAKYTGPQLDTGGENHGDDFLFNTQLFPANINWITLRKLMQKSETVAVDYLTEKLVCQGIMAQVFGQSTPSDQSVHMNRVLKDIIGCLGSSCDVDSTWSRKLCDISKRNVHVARWANLLANIYFWAPLLAHNTTETIGDILIASTLIPEQTSDSSERSNMVSIRRLSEAFVQSERFLESRTIQECVLKAVWKSLAETLTGTSKSPKKRKTSVNQIVEIFRHLGSSAASSRNCIQLVNSLLQQELLHGDSGLLESKLHVLDDHLKLLFLLPLEYLTADVASDCIIALHSVLFLLNSKPKSITKKHLELIQTVFNLLKVLLDSSKPDGLYNGLDLVAVLAWMLTFIHSVYSEVTQIVIAGYRFVVQQFVKQLTRTPVESSRLKPYVRLVTKKLHTAEGAAELTNGPVLLAALQLVQTLTKVAERDDTCAQYYRELSSVLLQVVQLNSTANSNVISIYLLDAYREMLLFETKHESEDSACQACLPLICDKSLVMLEHSQDEQEIMACTKLIRCVCNNHLLHKTSSHFQQQCWSILIGTCDKFTHHCKVLGKDYKENSYTEFNSENIDNPALKVLLRSVSNLNDYDLTLANENRVVHVSTNQNTSSIEVAIETGDNNIPSQTRKVDEVDMHMSRAELEKELFTTTGVFVAVTSEQQFKQILNSMSSYLVPPMIQQNASHVISTLKTCQVLMTLDLSQSQWSSFAYFIQMAVLQLQTLVSSACSRSTIRVTLAVLDFLAFLLTHGQMLLTPQNASSCLQVCFNTPLDKLACLDDYVTMYHAIYGVINALLMHHTQTVFTCIPAFLAATKVLLVSIIQRGRQQDTPTLQADVRKLIGCAHCMERIYTQINGHKTDFGKVAVYVIADYVTEVQQATLLPPIKKAVLLGIYEVLDLCDEHAIAQLHTVLDSAGKQIFQAIHNDFKTYHKYNSRT